ncbi:hypothetical protein C8J56DRAFT_1044091 [Mycena floridula]|nr:hypothetical protein C8J56DRAFT_1044091 [Mycena floridula]
MEAPEPSEAIAVIEEMTSSIVSSRQLIHSLNESTELDTKDGISLLSLKYNVLISYLRSLVLVSSRRAIGHSLLERTQPKQSFSDKARDERGAAAGDLVDSMMEGRIVLEKVKVLEGRMRYQIEKLLKVAKDDTEGKTIDVLNDPLAFRPNPQNLANDAEDSDEEKESGRHTRDQGDGIYRPPRLAPTPYIPSTGAKTKKTRQAPLPQALSSLLHASDPSQPHVESVSGLGGEASVSQMNSSRARYLKHLEEFEEGQFGRVILGKKEEQRRRRDEGILSMGGGLSGVGEDGSGGRRGMRAGGLEDEFMDVLKDSGRSSRKSAGGDGYEELRNRSKKGSILDRSRSTKKVVIEEDMVSHDKKRKRSRFELEKKNVKRRK